MNYVVLYNNAHTNAKKEEFMLKWIKSLFKPKRTSPVIPRNTFPRIKSLDSRIMAARGIKPTESDK